MAGSAAGREDEDVVNTFFRASNRMQGYESRQKGKDAEGGGNKAERQASRLAGS